MELREYIAIFKQHLQWFWYTVFACVTVVFVWQQSQPIQYQATLLLNIGRDQAQVTTDYAFDNFYRLQADERFADTVVRWLGAPRVVEDIYTASGYNTATIGTRSLKNIFSAKRLSSQVVEVNYTDRDTMTLAALSKKLIIVLNQYAASLNKSEDVPSWFVVIGGDPVIRDARISLPFALAVGVLLGVFLGFWVALLNHYVQATKNK